MGIGFTEICKSGAGLDHHRRDQLWQAAAGGWFSGRDRARIAVRRGSGNWTI
jgi:hypothetical protein